MIWAIFAAMAVVAVGFLVVPLLKARPKAQTRAEYDLAVYKDQLAEVDRDLERGVLNADQAEAARTEIQRRILAAADGAKDKGAKPTSGRGVAVAVVILLPVVSFGFYALLGRPGLPDQPMSARMSVVKDMEQQAEMFRGMVAQLAAKLEQNPNDGRGWAMMGRSLKVLGQPDKAHDAYRKAIKLLPTDATVRLEYASLLLDEVPANAPLPPDFVGLMREVNAIDPNQPDALYFLGVSEAQLGNRAKARDYWTRLLKALPEGSEDRGEIQKMIDGLK
jgi:cytochrome c-type biogenesis protein CcmH